MNPAPNPSADPSPKIDHPMLPIVHQLREQRIAAGYTLQQVASETRIPKRSLVLLEEGKFDNLPAEVFVRGFVQSYARFLGEEVETKTSDVSLLSDVVQTEESSARPFRFARKQRASNEQSSDSADDQQKSASTADKKKNPHTKESTSRAVSLSAPKLSIDDDNPEIAASLQDARLDPLRQWSLRAPTEQRGGLTLAVIILVIAATLTMSYLLREQPPSPSDGVTWYSPQGEFLDYHN